MYSMQVDDTIYQSSVLDSCSLLAPLSCLRVRGPASVFRGELGISCVLLSPCSSHGKGQAGPCVLPACFSGGMRMLCRPARRVRAQSTMRVPCLSGTHQLIIQACVLTQIGQAFGREAI